jgi:hypothetical protein
MGFLEDARKLADTYGPEAARHVGTAADKAWKHGSAFGQEVAKHAGPAAADTKERLNKLGKHGLHALSQVPNEYINQEYDWSFISQFREDMAKHLGSTAGDVWDKLGGGDILHDIGHAALSKIEFTQQDLPGFSERLKDWIVLNPKQFTTLLACIASGPIAQFVTPAMLGLVGFTPMGIAGGEYPSFFPSLIQYLTTEPGSIASAFQAGVGPIAANSAFAILTSAGMGGYGLAGVQATAIGAGMTGTCGVAAMAFLEAVKEDKQGAEKTV